MLSCIIIVLHKFPNLEFFNFENSEFKHFSHFVSHVETLTTPNQLSSIPRWPEKHVSGNTCLHRSRTRFTLFCRLYSKRVSCIGLHLCHDPLYLLFPSEYLPRRFILHLYYPRFNVTVLKLTRNCYTSLNVKIQFVSREVVKSLRRWNTWNLVVVTPVSEIHGEIRILNSGSGSG